LKSAWLVMATMMTVAAVAGAVDASPVAASSMVSGMMRKHLNAANALKMKRKQQQQNLFAVMSDDGDSSASVLSDEAK